MKKLLAFFLAVLLSPASALAAIAFDSNNGGAGGSSPLNISLTTAGTNELIVACSFDVNTNAANMTAKVDGVSMTQITSSQQASGDGNKMAMFYFLGSSAGAHTIAITSASPGGLLEGTVSSYNGVGQTGQPDNVASSTDDSLSTKTASLTVNTANSWMVLCDRWQGQDTNASTGSTKRSASSGGGTTLFDSNGALSAGSNSMTVTRVGGAAGGIGAMFASFSPPAAAGAASVNSSSQFMTFGDW